MAVQLRAESPACLRGGRHLATAGNASSGNDSAAPWRERVARTRVRFATTRALFETFPELRSKIGEPTDQCPIGFLTALASQGRLDEAVTFMWEFYKKKTDSKDTLSDA